MKRILSGSYQALSSDIVQSPRTADKVLDEVSRRIRDEMKHVCSSSHDSILRDAHEGIIHFSWDTVWVELSQQLPTLIKILIMILPNYKDNKNIICMIVCMLLKKRLNKVSLVQRVLSILLYGNGCSKQVCVHVDASLA